MAITKKQVMDQRKKSEKNWDNAFRKRSVEQPADYYQTGSNFYDDRRDPYITSAGSPTVIGPTKKHDVGLDETITKKGRFAYTGGHQPVATKNNGRTNLIKKTYGSKKAQEKIYDLSVKNGVPTENAITNSGRILKHGGTGTTVGRPRRDLKNGGKGPIAKDYNERADVVRQTFGLTRKGTKAGNTASASKGASASRTSATINPTTRKVKSK